MARKDFSVEWEDEDTEELPQASTAETEFAKMLEQATVETHEYTVGEKVEAKIISLGESEQVLLELDAQTTGVLDRSQLVEADGNLQYAIGDSLMLYVAENTDGDIQLSRSLKKSLQVVDDLQTAQQNRLPVKGRVVKENKGGFEVTILGKNAFCPVSQIDTRYVEDKAQYLGQELQFLITKVDNSGRNIVVSHSQFLKDVAAEKIKEIENNVAENKVYTGVVKEIRDFGAFIDIGGVEGLLPASELSFSRHVNVRDFLSPREEVKVQILRIEEKDGKKRLTFSMKSLETDPWTIFEEKFKTDETYSGRITKLEAFGAFVELTPGIEGLVHISEMSWEKRILHPREVVSTGDQVQVRLLSFDLNTKKISLSLKDITADPWHKAGEEFPQGSTHTGTVIRLKGFGAIVELKAGLSGMLPTEIMKKAHGESFRKNCSPPKQIKVTIIHLDPESKKISLSLPEINVESDDDIFKAYKEQSQEEKSLKPATTGFGQLLQAKLKQQQSKK